MKTHSLFKAKYLCLPYVLCLYIKIITMIFIKFNWIMLVNISIARALGAIHKGRPQRRGEGG